MEGLHYDDENTGSQIGFGGGVSTVKTGTLNHPKFKLLKARLGLTDWQATGILESVWQLTATAAWEGDIGKFADDLIAASIEWQDDAGELIAALVDAGWLDEVDDGRRLIVHDWHDHCPEYIRKRFQRRTPSDNGGHRPTPSANGALTQPNPTQPSQVKPERGRARFVPPTVEEIRDFCSESGFTLEQVDPEAVHDHYEANGWKQSRGTKIKDWKAAVRQWARRSPQFSSKGKNNGSSIDTGPAFRGTGKTPF